MDVNPLGLAAGAAAFFSVWLGHVAVRKIEARTVHLWKPVLAAVLLGLGFEVAALFTESRLLSAVCGILGITLLWDALELKRQRRRVQKGHAPANPANPLHAAWLADPASPATPLDLLDRDPLGRPVGAEEAAARVRPHREGA